MRRRRTTARIVVGASLLPLAVLAASSAPRNFAVYETARPEGPVVKVVTTSRETRAHHSLRRVELAIRSPEGADHFRAFYNPSSRVDPIPPEKFGLFPVGSENEWTDREALSLGYAGRIFESEEPSGTLLNGCEILRAEGRLVIVWDILMRSDFSPPGAYEIFYNVHPRRGKASGWTRIGSFTWGGKSTGEEDPCD